MPGVLWVGTDDGNVQISRDGGSTWTNVAKNVPGIGDTYHISRVEASHFDAGTCYLAVDGHRSDDLKPYLFVTRDYGATWVSIVSNLPEWGTVNVVREDPKNKDLLYVGTENGLFISFDGGREWRPFNSGMPIIRIDDILVHPRDNDLIVGTHGRGIYILDDIAPLQELSAKKVLDTEVTLFDVRPGTLWMNDPRLGRYWGGAKLFRGANPAPGTAITYYLKSAPSSDVKITISDYSGKVVRNITGTRELGLNRVQWNLRGDPPPRPPGGGGFGGGGGGGGSGGAGGGGGGGGGGFGGLFNIGLPLEAGTYNVKLTVNGKDYTTKAVIENDPGM
jgi:ligand-binding sensor domain-containing protein